jgi:hypothetical protein
MDLAVDLYRKPPLQTGEVHDVTTEWELPAKAQTVGTLAELLPEYDFWPRQFAAQPAGDADVSIRRADGAMADAPGFGPSTMLRMVPLPVPGRI